MWKTLARCAVVLGALGTAACQDCTQIGCAEPVRVKVVDAQGNPVQDFSGEARMGERLISFHCTAGSGTGAPTPSYFCLPGEVFLVVNAFPETIDLTVQGPDGTHYAATVRPEYVRSTNTTPLAMGSDDILASRRQPQEAAA